jgi:preprotein translocase subunit SecA
MFGLFDPLKAHKRRVLEINALEESIQGLTNDGITAESAALRHRAKAGESLDALLPRAFALAREASRRTLGQRHYDVQLIGGMVLHGGKIAEMATGEGKTLVATCPAYLNSLVGRGVHLVTVNDYLAKRDAVWMGQVYYLLGASVAVIAHDSAYIYDPKFKAEEKADKVRDREGSFRIEEDYLRPVTRMEAYEADIVYGTNHEFGFDYLRDNLAYSPEAQVQRGRGFAIIDEVDSILIDEARTPLIISAPDTESSEYYRTFSRIVRGLVRGEDYVVDEKIRAVDITQSGIDKVEKALGISDLYATENLRLVHYMQETLRAYGLFKLDKDYVSKDGEIVIVDQFTGRLMHGRRFSGGLHQAIEAKEGVKVQQESRTYAEVSIQNYFRLYHKLAGMTGTAQTSAEEFDKVYKLEAVTIPTHRPRKRKDAVDLIYKNLNGKFSAVVAEIKRRYEAGQPVLVGTAAIEKNELLSRLLSREGIPHEVLNAKNHEREGMIVAQAGRKGAVTVATNMAGRGVDIILGGNPPDAEEAAAVRALGGLHVIGTERHEARRIDNQLRGRAGRQGDDGSSQFFMSLEDDLLRVFGGERLKGLMERMDVPDDMPIESRLVGKVIEQAQIKVEGFNFDARKHLLDYDDVLNKQRTAVYAKRQELLIASAPVQALYALDMLWMTHLEDMESLRDSVRLRAYGQRDPLVEYRREAHALYRQMLAQFDEWMAENKKRMEEAAHDASRSVASPISAIAPAAPKQYEGTGRNDACPCGAKDASGNPLKYKRCHGA